MNRVVAWEELMGPLLGRISLNNHVSEVKCTRRMERSEQLDSTPRSAQAVIYSSECFGLLRLEGNSGWEGGLLRGGRPGTLQVQVGLWEAGSGETLVSYPSGLEGGLINEPVFKWLWLRKGCPNLSLGFPARESEVRRRKIFGF
jgi:hypothetical protein